MAKCKIKESKLIARTSLRVRFSEVDSMRIVWHGEYVRYMEDGREAFGREFEGLGYMDIYNSGYLTPIVDVKVQYKLPLKFDDEAIVEVRFVDSPAAKICLEYTISRADDGQVVATGSTIQVFTDANGELQLLAPKFYLDWKKRWGVIE